MAESGNNFLKEWEELRQNFKTYDDRLHELRKYGFTFITAFLTVSTILFQRWIVEPEGGVGGEAFPDSIKIGILFVTLLLILGVSILDRNYRAIEKSIFTRVTVLEKLLNIEISDIISQRFKLGWMQDFITALYGLFVIGVLGLGLVVLELNNFLILLAASLVFIVIIAVLSRDFVLGGFNCGFIDWILDKVECTQGDQVRIVMTNLGKDNFPKIPGSLDGQVMWKLVKHGYNPNTMTNDDPKIIVKKGVANRELNIRYTNNYIWLIETDEIKDGIYCLYRRIFDKETGEIKPVNEMAPLCRKLKINKKPAKTEPKPTVHHVVMKEDTEKE